MDRPLISESSFSTTNPSLTEIWPFSKGGDSGMLGLRVGSGSGFGNGFIDNLLNGQMNRDGSLEESTVTEQSGSVGANNARKRRDNVSEDESSKLVFTTTSGNEFTESNSKRMKTSCLGNCSLKTVGEMRSAKLDEKSAEPPKDFMHVIGKARVRDEIINYIQSLQRQVEFLSMKLEAVNYGSIPSVRGFHSKDVNQLSMPSFEPSRMKLSTRAREFVAAAAGGPHAEWLQVQLGGSFEHST